MHKKEELVPGMVSYGKEILADFSSRKMARISQEEFSGHDCHASAEDGCEVCVRFQEQKEEEARSVAASMVEVEKILAQYR